MSETHKTLTHDQLRDTEPVGFEVGQTVYDFHYGIGEVVEPLTYDTDYPVRVRFGRGRAEHHRTYTLWGAYEIAQPRCLFFSPPAVTAQMEPPKPPFVPTLEGRMVVVVWPSNPKGPDHLRYRVGVVVREREEDVNILPLGSQCTVIVDKGRVVSVLPAEAFERK